ncbi:uncharacterized protein OCT59_011135 [Rhizophagus irregularis]|uniref:uncharacterized protein n=1 Tax=Rhizophagus irregularis TaxID=588596 RepID=UPI0019FACFC9|nr:hypothetical protein OCT59_011135 [Rhizophagus irregularis]GBC23525.2 redoxin domain-containing protein [Rhizophagus irregularis DAOM 181602=DAOM 197198]
MDTTFFPETVVNIDGHTVNVDELAKRFVLIFITLKATWCPVCPQLLLILNFHGLKDDCPTSFCDPFDRTRTVTEIPQEEIPLNRFLLRQEAFFIIICPGPVELVRQIQNDCNFSNSPYHFVVDENLSLATSINLRMSRNEIWPCIAHIIPETLAIHPVFFGRGPSFYGYRDLLTYLREHRLQVEDNAEKLILKAMKVETRLRKSVLTEYSVENIQQQIQADQLQQEHREQIFPFELLSSIFEYLEPIEIVRSVTATSRLWRAIGLETIDNQMPYFSRIVMLKQRNKLIGIYELGQQINYLTKIVEISQRLLVYCNVV